MARAVLFLEDGTIFEGCQAGALKESAGEVVSDTSVGGYLEIITNPSSSGRIVSLCYPEAGAYGINTDDAESGGVKAAGLVMKHMSRLPNNWRSKKSLNEYLSDSAVPAISGVDTRALFRLLRKNGPMAGIISSKDFNPASLLKKIYLWKEQQSKPVSPVAKEYPWPSSKCIEPLKLFNKEKKYLAFTANKKGYKVAVIDIGVKESLLRILASSGFKVKVFPVSKMSSLSLFKPQGIVVSNGPETMKTVSEVSAAIKPLLGKVPVMGIETGAAVVAAALGAKVFRMKTGHRCSNHSVKNLISGAVEVVAQSHGLGVEPASLKNLKPAAKVTHINLNDTDVEGFECPALKAFGVFYYPAPWPGAHNAGFVIGKFINNMKKGGK